MTRPPPTVCELEGWEQRERETAIRRLLGRAAVEVAELPDGVAVRFLGDAEHLQRITELMALERACCRFLRFELTGWRRRRLRTTNGNERVNQELKRRTRVVRIFPNRASCLRLASALVKEWHEDWITGRRYLRMELLAEWRSDGPGKTEGALETAA